MHQTDSRAEQEPIGAGRRRDPRELAQRRPQVRLAIEPAPALAKGSASPDAPGTPISGASKLDSFSIPSQRKAQRSWVRRGSRSSKGRGGELTHDGPTDADRENRVELARVRRREMPKLDAGVRLAARPNGLPALRHLFGPLARKKKKTVIRSPNRSLRGVRGPLRCLPAFPAHLWSKESSREKARASSHPVRLSSSAPRIAGWPSADRRSPRSTARGLFEKRPQNKILDGP